MTKDIENIYVGALGDLERAAIQLADAMLRAAGAAQLADPRGEYRDHPAAVQAFKTCRESFVAAFAKAPGMTVSP